MIKKIFIAIVCCMAGTIYAQNSTGSPYSYFGVGELKSVGSIENQLMGGLSMFGDSIHINLNNPAAYGKLKLTTYAAAITRKEIGLNSATEKQKVSRTNLDYLSIAFPIANGIGVGFGLKPYSSVGYSLESNSTDINSNEVTNIYTGEGGLNTVYFSLGFKVIKDLTVGATANFNFGTVKSRRVQNVKNIQFGTFDFRESQIGGGNFKFAVNYTPMINDEIKMHTYLGIDTQVNMSSENKKTIGSFSSNTGKEIEKIEINLDAVGLKNRGIVTPSKTTIGVGFGSDSKWFIGTEYSIQDLSGYSAPFFEAQNVSYKTASKVIIGGFYIPDYSSFTDYYKRITYRAGVNFGNSGMAVNNQDINDFGITFGLGLPMRTSLSNLSIGFEIGKRGTTSANLIKENYFKLSIGLSLNDKWFNKRKID